jgi:hypothetical protein
MRLFVWICFEVCFAISLNVDLCLTSYVRFLLSVEVRTF